ARSEINSDWFSGCRGTQRVDCEPCEQFGLGPRHEHTWTDREVEVAERRAARDVLQRLTGGASGHERVEGGVLVLGENTIGGERGVHSPAAEFQHMTGEQFRIHPGIRDASLSEHRYSSVERGAQGPRPGGGAPCWG